MTRAPCLRSASMVGSDARMRASSMISPPSIGTLKSTRTRTRLSRASSSWMERLRFTYELLRALLRDEGGKVRDAAGVAPLVVVPGSDLDHVVPHHHRDQRVDDGGVLV